MKKLFKFLMQQAPALVTMAIVASLVSGLMNTVLLAMIKETLTDPDSLPQNIVLLFFASLVVLLGSRIAAQVLLVHLSEKTVYDLRLHLARRILGAPLRSLEELGPNKLLSALTDDIAALSQTLGMIPVFFMHMGIAGSIFAYLFWLHWPSALGLVFTAFFGAVMFFFLAARANRFHASARNEQDTLFKHYLALTQGTKELKLNRDRREEFAGKVLRDTASSNKYFNVMGTIFFTFGASISHMLFFLVIGLMLYIAPTYWPELNTTILLGFVLVVLYLLPPLDAVISIAPRFSKAMVSLKKIEDLGISLEKDSTQPDTAISAPVNWQKIEYRGITHAYFRERENESFTMGPIDLTLKPGELVFLIGGNGSGKTTLAKMLVGLYHADKGAVFLDGKEVTEDNRDAFRQLFSAVFTDFFLFETLMGIDRENLTQEITRYLEILQLNHKVSIKDGELSTVDLSQGQRKRLALLTAYLEDRSIYLFDEWAADQDPLFKDFFYKVLVPQLQSRGKTVLVISHDDHYFHTADRIVKLDYGQLEFDRTNLELASETP